MIQPDHLAQLALEQCGGYDTHAAGVAGYLLD